MKKFLFVLVLSLFCGPAFAQKNMSCDRMNVAQAYDKGNAGFRYLVPGKDGFIFRSQADFKQDFSLKTSTQEYLGRAAKMLKARGTAFVMLVQPTRGIMARAFIDPANSHAAAFKPEEAAESYRALIGTLGTLGIVTTDITAGAPDHYFFRRDIHWTYEGADHSAQQIAQAMDKAGLLKPLPKVEFTTLPGGSGGIKGGLAGAVEKICGSKLPEETYVGHETSAKQTDSAALFSEDKPGIVLTGTSNSTAEAPHFEGVLKQRLGVDVLNLSVTGGGPDTAILDYLSSDSFHKAPPAALIWEVPGHYQMNNKSLYLQMLPALSGACKNPVGGRELTLSKSTRLLVDSRALGSSKKGGYIHLTLKKGSTPKSLKARLLYGEKKSKDFELISSERMKRRDLFLELESRSDKFPDAVVLEAASPTTVHAEFCAYSEDRMK